MLIKFLSASLVTLIVLLIFTILYLWWHIHGDGTRATGVNLMLYMTLGSPVYWLIVGAIMAGLSWVFRGWF
jgi:hypothetical protein